MKVSAMRGAPQSRGRCRRLSIATACGARLWLATLLTALRAAVAAAVALLLRALDATPLKTWTVWTAAEQLCRALLSVGLLARRCWDSGALLAYRQWWLGGGIWSPREAPPARPAVNNIAKLPAEASRRWWPHGSSSRVQAHAPKAAAWAPRAAVPRPPPRLLRGLRGGGGAADVV